MTATFYISCNLTTPDGFESFAKFYLGDDKNEAVEIFELLRGDDEVSDRSVLTMDLTQEDNGIPITIKMIHCSLDELTSNTKIISREIFKRNHLKIK